MDLREGITMSEDGTERSGGGPRGRPPTVDPIEKITFRATEENVSTIETAIKEGAVSDRSAAIRAALDGWDPQQEGDRDA